MVQSEVKRFELIITYHGSINRTMSKFGMPKNVSVGEAVF